MRHRCAILQITERLPRLPQSVWVGVLFWGIYAIHDRRIQPDRGKYNIETVKCEGTDRFGNKMTFARYYLRDDATHSE